MICPDCQRNYTGRRCEACYKREYRKRNPESGRRASAKSYRKSRPLKPCRICSNPVPNNKHEYCAEHSPKRNKEVRNAYERNRLSTNNPIVTKECQHNGTRCERTFQAKQKSVQKYCKPCQKERNAIHSKQSKERTYARNRRVKAKLLAGTPDTHPDAIKQAQRQVAKVGQIRRWSDEPPVSLLKGELPKRVRPNYKQFGVK